MSEEETYDYDLDALIVEAENAPPFRFKWGGEAFEIPLMATITLEDQLALETMTTSETLRMLMGDAEFERLLAARGGPSGDKEMSGGRMNELVQRYNRHQGLEPGESRASRRSSGNTARPSKRTSRSGR